MGALPLGGGGRAQSLPPTHAAIMGDAEGKESTRAISTTECRPSSPRHVHLDF
jgi:hypothetical protein